jgi:hypothetical protein
MLVGLDFDNTIVRYDALFHRLAKERGLLAEDVPATKGHVRDYLRRIGREDDWTELQGVAYGPRIVDAEPFPGVVDFLKRCVAQNIRCVIISHKTKTPYLGPKYDLHDAAHQFLKAHGFYDASTTGITRAHVYLELTKLSKLERIGSLDCDAFVDDLPELLAEPTFPKRPRKILFDPADAAPPQGDFCHAKSWEDVGRFVYGMEDVHQ